MTTTDSNGLVQFQTGDRVEPLQTALNLITASVSAFIGTTVQTFSVSNNTQRDALAVEKGPTSTNPLLVWVQSSSKFFIHKGAGWEDWPPVPVIPQQTVVHHAGKKGFGAIGANKTLAVRITFPTDLINFVSNWAPQVTLSATARAGLTHTISNYTKTGFTVNIRNAYTTAAKGGVINWALLLVNT